MFFCLPFLFLRSNRVFPHRRADQVIVLMTGDNRSKGLATIQSENHILSLINLFDCVLLYLVAVISSVHIILRSSFSSGCCYIECSHIILLNGNEKFLDFSFLRTVKICNNLNLNHLKTILCKYLSHHLHQQPQSSKASVDLLLCVSR